MASGRNYPNLEQLVEQIAEIRPLPSSATRILELTEGDQFSAHDLATAIAQDQALTAKLLRLANSAYYGYPRRISTVRDAVVLLGFREVRSAALVSSLIDGAPGTTNVDYAAFWQFSLSVGMVAEMLARTEGQHRDHAFTAGVLHNLGRLALDQNLPDALGDAIDAARETRTTIERAEAALLGFTDIDLGAALAEAWSFPPALVHAIAGHATAADQPPAPESLTGYVVRARDFARSFGVADGTEMHRKSDPPEEWTRLPLSATLERSGGMERLMERVDAFLQSASLS